MGIEPLSIQEHSPVGAGSQHRRTGRHLGRRRYAAHALLRRSVGRRTQVLRYCELLYQGQGFELSQIKPIAELPVGFQPRLIQNFTLLAQTLPGELRSLAADIGAFVKDPSRRFNRAQKTRGFLTGKNGGEYQVHTPGISFLMFPAYYLDRQLGGPGRRADAQWPERLIAVNGFFLSVYAVWVLLVFRFLRRVVGSTWVPWITTIALMLTMPVAAFPFQFYAETAAGVILVWVAGHLLFPGRGGLFASLFAGLLAGYLPWLHVRFSAMAMVLVVGGIIMLRGTPRRAGAFLGGAIASLGSMSLYAYHLTGSILPWSMWQEESGRVVLSVSGAIYGSYAYLVDSEWGLFAHSPVYLLVLPGYWLMARRRPDIAWMCGLVFLSLLLPAAAHTLHAAGATPMRLIVAAVPFAAVPLVELLARRGRSPSVQVAFGLLLLVSLHTALAYNLHLREGGGLLLDRSFSGWKANLLFPRESRGAWEVSSLQRLVVVHVGRRPPGTGRCSSDPALRPSCLDIAIFRHGGRRHLPGAWQRRVRSYWGVGGDYLPQSGRLCCTGRRKAGRGHQSVRTLRVIGSRCGRCRLHESDAGGARAAAEGFLEKLRRVVEDARPHPGVVRRGKWRAAFE